MCFLKFFFFFSFEKPVDITTLTTIVVLEISHFLFLKTFSITNEHLTSFSYFQHLFASILETKKKLSRVQEKIIKLLCVQEKTIKLSCVQNTKKFYIFLWHFFIEAVLVEMKRLKSFFLCNVVVLHVINKSFFFEKVVCSENET